MVGKVGTADRHLARLGKYLAADVAGTRLGYNSLGALPKLP
jgi:hypothetical protein